MSNLLIKNAQNKHFRILSKHSRIDSAGQEDVIEDLKMYRNSQIRRNSPFKLKTPTIKTNRLASTEEFRPGTAEFSIPTTRKAKKFGLANPKVSEIRKFSFGDKSLLNTSKTSAELRNFLDSFQFLTHLKLDIELNAEIVKEKKILTDKSLGIYFLLNDRMISENFDVANTDQINKYLKEYCGYFRDILRNLGEKNVDEELVNLELLWRLLLKILDTSLLLQEKTVNNVINSANQEVRTITEKCEKSLSDQKKGLEAMNLSLKMQIADQTKTIKLLKKENYDLDRSLKEKEAYITDLLEPESQDISCQEMRKALKKLSSYITESENEQIKQVNTLRDLSSIMAVAEQINKRPESCEENIQTDWTIDSNNLPQLEYPILTVHPFNKFFGPKKGQFQKNMTNEIISICENSLNNSENVVEFYQEVLILLLNNNRNTEKISAIVMEMVNVLNKKDSISKNLFFWLLRLNGENNLPLEQTVILLNKCLLGFSEGKFITFSKFLDFLSNFSENDQKTFETVLEKIKKYNGDDLENRFQSLIFRLYIACQKSKSLELVQEKIHLNEFRDQIKSQSNWVISTNDLSYFFENLSPDSDLNSFFNSASMKINSIRIEKNELLYLFLIEHHKKNIEIINHYDELWRENNIDKFIEISRGFKKDITDRECKLAFLNNILSVPKHEILEKFFGIDFVGCKVQKSQPQKKKSPKKFKK